MNQVYNPFNYGTPVSGKYFVGRDNQIRTMADDLANPRGHSFALIGGRRFGKSSFLEALQGLLIQRLSNANTGQWFIFPILVSLKSLQDYSTQGVFTHLLRTLRTYFVSPLTRKNLGLKLDFAIAQTQLATFNQQECSYEQFSDIMEDVIMHFEDTYGTFRPVFLLDEVEAILNQKWTEEIFSQLRSLIYVGKLRDYMRCVIAGSSKIIEVREKGSPLFNMLNVVYLEAVDEQAIREIISWADNVSDDFVQAVMHQCGGHPYLAQFLMHHAWDTLSRGATPPISSLVNRFRSEAHSSLEQWQTDLGNTSLIAYQILADANTWLTEAQVKQCVQDRSLIPHIGVALVYLCYHGLVKQRGTWYEYHVTGQLFQDWFTNEVRSMLHAPIASPTSVLQTPQQNDLQNRLEGEPTIKIQFPKPAPPNYPTAYYDVMTVDSFPFVTCTIDNTHADCTNTRITIAVTLNGLSETVNDTAIVYSNQIYQKAFLPRVSREKALSLNTPNIAHCHVLVKRYFMQNDHELHSSTYEVRMLSYNTALYAIKDDQGRLSQNLADFLAVFVTPYQQAVIDFVLEATNKHPDRAFDGYPPADTAKEEARTLVRAQAKALFIALQQQGLRYIFSANSFGIQANEIAQRIRLPSESLPKQRGQKGQASCLDGAILFASLLEHIMIDPFIVLIKGHALVGWHILKRKQPSDCLDITTIDLLETTMIQEVMSPRSRKFAFEDALIEGHRKYVEAKSHGDDQRPFLDPLGFLYVVDIAACRSRNINPLT